MNIKKTIILRLAIAWFVMTTVTGIVIFYFETERVDHKVLALAVDAEKQLSTKLLADYNQAISKQQNLYDLHKTIEKMNDQGFAIIELYDKKEKKIIEKVHGDFEDLEIALSKLGHSFPLINQTQYQKHWIEDQLILQVLIPIVHNKQLEGYFEGVYLVSENTMQQINTDVFVTVLIAMLIILATTLIYYPVMLALNKQIIKQSKDLLQGNIELMQVLGSAIAMRDSDTNIHNYRVTLYSISLAEKIGLDHHQIKNIITGAFLHDVGKIGISDNILLKPGKLTDEEFEIMKTHVTLGMEILSSSEWLQSATDIVQYHHEKYDGTGYMYKKQGKEIPLNARIFAIVDVFDALTSERPYKKAMPFQQAIDILKKDSGSHFDPELIKEFLLIAKEIYNKIYTLNEEQIMAKLTTKTEKYFFY